MRPPTPLGTRQACSYSSLEAEFETKCLPASVKCFGRGDLRSGAAPGGNDRDTDGITFLFGSENVGETLITMRLKSYRTMNRPPWAYGERELVLISVV